MAQILDLSTKVMGGRYSGKTLQEVLGKDVAYVQVEEREGRFILRGSAKRTLDGLVKARKQHQKTDVQTEEVTEAAEEDLGKKAPISEELISKKERIFDEAAGNVEGQEAVTDAEGTESTEGVGSGTKEDQQLGVDPFSDDLVEGKQNLPLEGVDAEDIVKEEKATEAPVKEEKVVEEAEKPVEEKKEEKVSEAPVKEEKATEVKKEEKPASKEGTKEKQKSKGGK